MVSGTMSNPLNNLIIKLKNTLPQEWLIWYLSGILLSSNKWIHAEVDKIKGDFESNNIRITFTIKIPINSSPK